MLIRGGLGVRLHIGLLKDSRLVLENYCVKASANGWQAKMLGPGDLRTTQHSFMVLDTCRSGSEYQNAANMQRLAWGLGVFLEFQQGSRTALLSDT